MWKWKNKILEEIPKNKVGFIYIIENIKTKQFYIGKKQFFNSKTVKLSNKKPHDTNKIFDSIHGNNFIVQIL